MHLSYFLLAASVILAATVDGLADENNKSSTPNVQVAVKGGNAATEGMVVLQSDDIDDTQQVAGRAVATEERVLRALASPWLKDAVKAFRKNPLGFVKVLRKVRKWFG
ncbi:hypothetical protein PI124_g2579 [Phytophthora idaei]|nr:hypothetical protein PI125_g12343 [Phytophthora idaei]KAG3148156.1 hypothetical protein PI126_g12564 [Phytophthora idaei]KAG3252866.1 hypothetical protein PI124_g2579 [Phytophthora idaei]